MSKIYVVSLASTLKSRLMLATAQGVAMLVLSVGGAVAQQAEEPVPASNSDLPPVVVQSAQKPAPTAPKKTKSKAKVKSSGSTAASSEPVPGIIVDEVAPTAGEQTSEAKLNTPTRPGLNLNVPTAVGSRLDLTPLQTPASVDVISGEVARDRGQHTVTDAVTRNAPGFSSVASPAFGSAFASRGFQGNGSVVRLYDGMRISPGNGSVTFPFNTWSVDRIEVMHGPASVLYGEGAIGGVINVVPKKPITTHFENTAQLFVDSNMTRRFSFDSAGPINDALAYRFDVTGDRSDGWIDNGDSENFGISGALRLQASPELVFTLSSDYGNQEPMRYFGTPFRDGKIDKSLRDKNYNVDNSLIVFRDNWTQLKSEYTPTDWLSFRNVAYMMDSRREWRNAENFFLNDITGQVDRSGYTHIRQKQDSIGSRTDATIKSRPFGLDNQTVVGFEVARTKFGYANHFPFFASSVDAYNFDPGLFPEPDVLNPRFSSQMTQYSVFAEDRVKLTDEFTVIGGVRYDTPELERRDIAAANSFEKSFNAFGWRIGAVYEPVRNLAFYGQYAVASDPINVPLLDLAKNFSKFDLTTGKEIEVGVKQAFWNGKGEWTLSAYKITKNDLLVLDPFFNFQQIGQQSSRGVEASVGFELGHGWRVDANAAWLKAKYDEFQYVDFSTFSVNDYSGKTPLLVPEQTANIWLTWAFARDWQASAGLQYIGSSYENFDNTVERAAYTIVNAGLQWKPTDAMTLDFRVENIFDKVYAQYLKYDDPAAFGSGGLQGYLGMPRTFQGALTVKF